MVGRAVDMSLEDGRVVWRLEVTANVPAGTNGLLGRTP